MAGPVALRADAVRAVVDVERGGRVASLVIDGHEILVGPPDATDRSIRWGLFVMAPWVGRLSGGRLHWGGSAIQLPRNHGRHAIHGLTFDRAWQVDRREAASSELSIELDRGRWPFGGRVRQRLELRPDSLDLAAEIEADEPMPAALGWHPWFRRALADGDDGDLVRLRVAATDVLERRAMIPTGRTVAVRGSTDLRAGPALGSRRLDDAFVGVRESPMIDWPALRLTLRIADPLSVVTVYSPPDALCVEPQTGWPNALGLPGPVAGQAGAVIVNPGRPLRVGWSLHWQSRSPRSRE